MEKRWVLKEIPNETSISRLIQQLNISKILATILAQRGVDTFDKAKSFFRPSLDELHDPFLMKDMDHAVKRLNVAIKNQEKILIYGDYDVDGTTSVALVYGFLKKYYDNLDFYIPDRYKEGYGVSDLAVQWAAKNNFKLIITIDCGIKANNQIIKGKKQGIDFIVCDHHTPDENLPEAIAVLDPKRNDCPYPFKELAGCGIGFKLIQAYCINNNISLNPLFRNLDLVCISIASDLVPIVGENRILAYYGLKVLNKNPRPGLKALIDISGYTREINISGIVFGLGPRINAAGRIEHAIDSVKLLLASNEDEASKLAHQLNLHNTNRKDFDMNITREALEMIDNNETIKASNSTVLYKSDWHKGVIGIVASRCIEKYYRPTIILTKSDGKATGSARSVNGFDLYKALVKCSDLLDKFGGHKYAAGLTLPIENIDAFKSKFEEVVTSNITPDQLIPQINIDINLDFRDIGYKLYQIISRLAPFGPGNMQPVFVSSNVKTDKSARLLKDQHIKMFVSQKGFTKKHEAIGFRMAEFFDRISKEEYFDMAYTIEEAEYRGNKYLQLVVKDIRFAH